MLRLKLLSWVGLVVVLLSGCHTTPKGEDVSVMMIKTGRGVPTGAFTIDGRRGQAVGGALQAKPVIVEPGEHTLRVGVHVGSATVKIAARAAYQLTIRKLETTLAFSLVRIEPDTNACDFAWQAVGREPPRTVGESRDY